MDFTVSTLLSFLSNYLLAATVCFVGSLVREAQQAMKSHCRIVVTKVILNAVASGFLSCLLYSVVATDEDATSAVKVNLYMAMCFAIGYCSYLISDILGNKNIIIGFIKTMISKTGAPGKAFVDAWNEEDEKKKAAKEAEAAAKSEESSASEPKKGSGEKSSKTTSKEKTK